MIDHLTFIFYLYLFLFSSVGYGLKFSSLINQNLKNLNLGWYGIVGFLLISIISIITSFFTPHNYFHNFLVHSVGLFFFVIFFFKNKQKKDFKLLFYISLSLIIGAYVFKNHDDFSYYHLTYALNLSENSFIVGTGNFSHGFRTFSSLFYYHSTLYLPFIEYYLFHIGPFFILVFFNMIMIDKIINNKKDINRIVYYYSLLSLVFVNIVFYRIGEHGTDRSSQILLILIFLLFIEILNLKKNDKLLLSYISLITILILLASSMKAIYYLYFILIPIVLFKKDLFRELLKLKNTILISFVFVCIFLNLLIYFLNTGCFLYPADKTCLIQTDWSIPIEEVKLMSIHYEWWAKAGGGPGYAHELNKSEYIENFVWFKNWVDKHFFNKVSDTLLGTILICFLIVLSYYYQCENNKFSKKNNYYLFYFIILIFLAEWFLNHPSMRYGGYVLIGLPIIFFSSSILERFKISNKKIFRTAVFFLIISILIFNFRNVVRLNKEIEIYKYKPLESPFFFVEKIDSKIIFKNKKSILYTPLNGSCWASKTPCSYNKRLKMSKFLWMDMVSRDY